MTTTTPAEQIAAATSLEDLRDLFAELEDADATDLPTFGGEAPASGTSEVWSWDAERLLVGTCADDLRIVRRSDWNQRTRNVEVWAPATPGAKATLIDRCATVTAAEELASDRFGRRRDLNYQDVTIEVGGKRIAYAGPSR